MNASAKDRHENLYNVIASLTVEQHHPSGGHWSNVFYYKIPPGSPIILLGILDEDVWPFPERQLVVLTSLGIMYVYEKHFIQCSVPVK